MGHRLAKWGRFVGIGVVLVWSVFPVYWALNTSFLTNAQAEEVSVPFAPIHPVVTGYQAALFNSGPDAVFSQGGLFLSLMNSAIESGGAVLITLVVGTLGAYAFARLRFHLKPLLFYLVLATLALPIYATLIPVYKILTDVHLINTYIGIIMVYTSGFLPLAMWILYNTFLAVPVSIEEAARVDGVGTMGTFFRIAVPLAGPGIAATGIICFLLGWGAFIFPLVLSNTSATEPFTVWIAALQLRRVSPFNVINAAAIAGVLVPSAIVLVLHRWIVAGITAGSVK